MRMLLLMRHIVFNLGSDLPHRVPFFVSLCREALACYHSTETTAKPRVSLFHSIATFHIVSHVEEE